MVELWLGVNHAAETTVEWLNSEWLKLVMRVMAGKGCRRRQCQLLTKNCKELISSHDLYRL